MHDERDRHERPASRRRFLQAAGALTAGLSMAARTGWAERLGGAAAEGGDACGCDAQPALPLYSVALHQGAYVALAARERGLGLFALDVDSSQRVSLGAPLEASWPEGFQPAALGVAGGRLLLGGGLPFVWDRWEVDDEADGAVVAAMDDWPAHVAKTGRRVIEAPGLRPAAFVLDLPYARPLALPELPRRLFGVIGGVTETRDAALVLLHEHSGERREGWYASAVDALVRRDGAWSIQAAGRELGESGPNRLAADGDRPVVALRTAGGVSLAWPGRARRIPAPDGAGRVLGLVSGVAGAGLLTGGGREARWHALTGGAFKRSVPVSLDGDEIVGALDVAGAPGQGVLLGRGSARLVEEAAVLAGRAQGGEPHVV